MLYNDNWAVIIPMANEAEEFDLLITEITAVLNKMKAGIVYLIIDKASTDNTLALAQAWSKQDERFITIWAPENKNVVDAYLKGYEVAYHAGHELIIEMDAGMSHDPKAIPMFLRVLSEGNDCAFGSRFINGGSMSQSVFKRRLLSKTGTILANIFLGTSMYDMTSGFQGLHRNVVAELLKHKFISKAHFYQTEIRYILRKHKMIEIPIHYKAPSPRVSKNAINNALYTLFYYFCKRITFQKTTI